MTISNNQITTALTNASGNIAIAAAALNVSARWLRTEATARRLIKDTQYVKAGAAELV
jgi:hypothetical protein